MHRVCPVCGAYLDLCEVCDCKEEAAPGEQDRKAAQVNDFTDIIAIQKINVKEGVSWGKMALPGTQRL